MLLSQPDVENVSLYPAWKEALKNFIALSPVPGTVVRVDWLNAEFELTEPKTAEDQRRYSFAFMSAFEKFREALLVDHKICLGTLYNGTYIVVPPQEQTKHAAVVHTRRIHKEMNHMIKKMHHVDHSALTDEQSKQNSDALTRAV